MLISRVLFVEQFEKLKMNEEITLERIEKEISYAADHIRSRFFFRATVRLLEKFYEIQAEKKVLLVAGSSMRELLSDDRVSAQAWDNRVKEMSV